eukprot:gene13152-biopygen10485
MPGTHRPARKRQNAYKRTRPQQQPETFATRPTEQPVTVPLDEMLPLQLQEQQAQQQAIPTLQAQQGSQFWPVPYPFTSAHLHPLQGQQPKSAELYIMDTAEALEHRAHNPINRDLNRDTIKKLQDELLAFNPYA